MTAGEEVGDGDRAEMVTVERRVVGTVVPSSGDECGDLVIDDGEGTMPGLRIPVDGDAMTAGARIDDSRDRVERSAVVGIVGGSISVDQLVGERAAPPGEGFG